MVDDDNAEIANEVVYKSVRSITSCSKLGIQSIQSGFILIMFNDDRKD